MMTEKRVDAQQSMNAAVLFGANGEVKEQACCGRSYNEVSDFSQINFATFQSILDKRNELLRSVKPQSLL